VRLVHLSDLHLGGGPSAALRAGRVLALLDHAIARGAEHVLLGGDLVDHGNLDDLLPLRDHLARRGFGEASRLTVVPGNHDVWPFGEESLWGDAGRYLAENARSLATLAGWPAQERYRRFAATFAPSFDGVIARGEEDPYPCLKRLGGISLAILDTTSNHGAFRSARGRFDAGEAAWLEARLDAYEGPRLLLMHHWPLRWDVDAEAIVEDLPRPARAVLAALGIDPASFADVNFEDLDAVQAFLRRARFDAVICGHLHAMSDDPRDPAFDASVGSVPVHCMGRSGAVHQEEGREVFAYHVIDAGERGVTVETVFVEAAELDG
jgi:3',5'-cyclic AMP phosphodiesterase CpdA